MLKLVKFVVVAVVAIVVLAFAFANRQSVSVSFDPFASGEAPAFAIAAPLFLLLIAALILGVIIGGAAVWLSQGRFRRAARQSRVEVQRLRSQHTGVPSVR
jgi:uncharacterized membrane protein YciS (DUF1049 family)